MVPGLRILLTVLLGGIGLSAQMPWVRDLARVSVVAIAAGLDGLAYPKEWGFIKVKFLGRGVGVAKP